MAECNVITMLHLQAEGGLPDASSAVIQAVMYNKDPSTPLGLVGTFAFRRVALSTCEILVAQYKYHLVMTSNSSLPRTLRAERQFALANR